MISSSRPSGRSKPSWAWLRSGDVDLMVTRVRRRHRLLVQCCSTLYRPDVAEAREALEAAGVECGLVQFPFYAPGGEFEVRDPDGYSLMVTYT